MKNKKPIILLGVNLLSICTIFYLFLTFDIEEYSKQLEPVDLSPVQDIFLMEDDGYSGIFPYSAREKPGGAGTPERVIN